MHKKLKQTREEKTAYYMTLEKEKIAEMLAEANIHLDYYTGKVKFTVSPPLTEPEVTDGFFRLVETFNKEMIASEERAERVKDFPQRRFYQGEARTWKYAAKKLQRLLRDNLLQSKLQKGECDTTKKEE